MNTLAPAVPADALARASARARPLRWRLLVLAVAGLLPLAVAATASLLYVMHEREAEAQRVALHTARAIAVSLRGEIDGAVGTLQALATADPLQDGRLAAFEDKAKEVAQARQWRTVTLADAQGRLLFAAGRGSLLAAPVDPASLEQALKGREPVVGRLTTGPQRRAPAFAVRVPVLRNGETSHVLSAVIGSEHVLELVKQQNLPATQVIAIFDTTGTRVARSLDNADRRASPSLQALIDRGGREGTGITRTLEGEPVHTAFHRVEGMGWMVAVGLPASEVTGALTTSMAVGLAGLAASIALSAWLAWIYSRKVSSPIEELKAAAAALGHGEPVHEQSFEIEELDEVGRALAQASRERAAAAADRERLLAQATEALQMAEAAARSKDEFLAVLGHELRNPLAPIAGALHLMSLKGDEATRGERRIVERQLGHMTRLVDDLLDVSRITGGKLQMQLAPMRVGPWIEQVVEAVRGAIQGRELQVDLPAGAEQAWVQGDPVRLAQVLGNLLGNAIKFTGERGRIRVSAALAGQGIEVDVEDDGIGLAPADLARVFELFYQAPSQRSSSGLGLGLAIVRSLVEMHGGRVRAASEGVGHGSRFTLWLPTTEAPAQAVTGPAPLETPAGAAGTRVLVVDDNTDAADTAAALLETCGFEVRVAYDPQRALRLLEQGFDARIALLDIGLPGMDGYQLARALRAREGGAAMGLVALTGYGQERDVQRALASGFDAHMTKPVDVDALLALLGRFAAG